MSANIGGTIRVLISLDCVGSDANCSVLLDKVTLEIEYTVLEPVTISVTKRFDTGTDDGAIDEGDGFVPGWGITLTCNIGNAQDNILDGGVTDGTDLLVASLGVSLNGGPLIEGTSRDFILTTDDDVSVAFLNDPVEVPLRPTPPGGTPPPSLTTPEPEPTEPVVAETPEPIEPATPEPIVESTPVAPDSGSGLASSSGNSATLLLLAAAALMAFGAAGTFRLAKKRD